MKVMSYFQACSLDSDNRDIYWDFMYINFNKYGSTDLNKFYSQKFRPELIVELFDGWEEGHETDYFHKEGAMVWFHESWYYEVQKNYLSNTIKVIIPRTLDDFINDANRAGISLEWR